MNVASVVVLVVIVALSIVGVLTASEPLDKEFEIEIALAGLPFRPLATKIMHASSKPAASASANLRPKRGGMVKAHVTKA